MPFWRILTVGFGAQLIALGAGATLAGLGGGGTAVLGRFKSGWLDILNTFGPFWFVACLAGVLLVALAFEPRRSKTAVLAVGFAGLIVSGAPIAGELIARVREAAGPQGVGPTLRVMTFNVFEDNFMPERAVLAIQQSGADVVAVQEPRNLQRLLPQLRRLYPFQTNCVGLDCRVLILAKRQPLAMSVQRLDGWLLGPMKTAQDGSLTLARIDFVAPDGKPATLVTTHMIWPAPPLPKRRQQEILAHYVRGTPRDRLIVTGDFNLTPWAFAMRRQDADLRPLRRVTHALPSWPAVVPRFNIPWDLPFLPLDHIYVGPGWRMQALTRLPRAASDHLPLLIDLKASRR